MAMAAGGHRRDAEEEIARQLNVGAIVLGWSGRAAVGLGGAAGDRARRREQVATRRAEEADRLRCTAKAGGLCRRVGDTEQVSSCWVVGAWSR